MRNPSRDLRYGAFGVLTGVAAVAAGRCGGGSCLSCFACAVPGALVLVAALGGRPGGAEECGPRCAEQRSCGTCRRLPACEIARHTRREVAICSQWEPAEPASASPPRPGGEGHHSAARQSSQTSMK